jgi:hypothetical protein
MEERTSPASFWLKILKDAVTEPAEVKTVSKRRVSEDRNSRASGLVMTESFLQERKQVRRAIRTNKVFFMDG